jgi:hypothetical protein
LHKCPIPYPFGGRAALSGSSLANASGGSHFFFGFFFDPTCSNKVKAYIATHREREIERKVNREREIRERENCRYIVLRQDYPTCPIRERNFGERESPSLS